MPNSQDYSEICYKENFLKEVIARIDFVSPIELLDEELPKEISKVALKTFPIMEPIDAITQELLLKDAKLSTREHRTKEWVFFGRGRNKQLTITPTSIFIVYKQYKKYENFRENFLSVVNALFARFPDVQPRRLGIRYVNQIETHGDALDWKGYISDDLLYPLNYEVMDAKLSRVFSNYVLAFDNFNLKFQFGMHNPDFPAPIRRKLFILDYDAYFEGLLEHQEIPSNMDLYHNKIQTIFENSIGDKLREEMSDQEG